MKEWPLKEWTEEEDYGCIEGCMLADVLSEIMSSLCGGYAVLSFLESEKENPDMQKIEEWDKRSNEIFIIRRYFSTTEKTYKQMREWIMTYAEESKQLRNIRKQNEKRDVAA